MTDENDQTRTPKTEILAPERGVVLEGNRSMVVSAFNRVRNQVLQKELAAVLAKGRTWNEIVSTLRDSERLRQEYQAALIRSENLPMLRAAEEAKIFSEVQRIFDDEADRQRDRTIRNVRAEAELIRAQRDLDALKNPPNAQPEGSRSQRHVAAIKRIREERDEMIAIIAENRTDEQLTEEDRQLINDIRLAADNEVKNMLEERE